jgi:uncharacterized surface protein with fasciclin (FAS1) repeats
MRSTRRAHALIAALTLTGALGLAACGGDDSADSAATATTASSMSTVTSMATGSSMASGSDAMMGAFGPACAQVPADGAGSFSGMATAPAATAASNNPVLSTLVGAVQSAGLVDTLNGPGPFTIFAPANDAFGKVDPAALSSAMADPTGALTKILTYHVVAGENLDAEALAKAGTLQTVEGGKVTISGSGENLMVNGAKVVCGNVKTANATVYIIDSVLMPS